MNAEDDDTGERWEVLPAGVMRAKYGLYAENRPVIKLDPSGVPPALWGLIPLAEQFGVSDDLIRQDVLTKTPTDEVTEMRRAVEAHNDLLSAWLSGPDANGPT